MTDSKVFLQTRRVAPCVCSSSVSIGVGADSPRFHGDRFQSISFSLAFGGFSISYLHGGSERRCVNGPPKRHKDFLFSRENMETGTKTALSSRRPTAATLRGNHRSGRAALWSDVSGRLRKGLKLLKKNVRREICGHKVSWTKRRFSAGCRRWSRRGNAAQRPRTSLSGGFFLAKDFNAGKFWKAERIENTFFIPEGNARQRPAFVGWAAERRMWMFVGLLPRSWIMISGERTQTHTFLLFLCFGSSLLLQVYRRRAWWCVFEHTSASRKTWISWKSLWVFVDYFDIHRS